MLALFCAVALPQSRPADASTESSQPQTLTFQSGVNLVLVPVTVRNKQGQAVDGLTKDDFEIFDKGKRQSIASFSVIEQARQAAPAQAASNTAPGNSNTVSASNSDSGFATAAQTPPPKDTRRNVIYLFDDIDAGFADFGAVRAAMISHIGSLSPTDYAAIYAFSGRPQLDFTTNRDQLEKTAAKLRMSLADVTADSAKGCPDINYYLADRIINKDDQHARNAAIGHTADCEHVPAPQPAEAIMQAAAQRQLTFVPQQTRMALRSLRLAITRLSGIPGERVIILSSPGFFQTAANDGDMEYVLRLAAQSHVTINALNVRGLYSNEPDASDEHNREEWRRFRLESWQAAEDVMRDLTQSTGGLFIHNDGGFRQAFDKLAAPPECSYVLGFVSTFSKPDSTFHSLKIRLSNGKGLTIQARRGYYALQGSSTKQAARFAVDDAVFTQDERHDLPVIIQTGYVAPGKGDPTITALVKINLDSLRFRTANQRNLDTLTVVAAIFTEDGSYLVGTSKTVNLQLQDKTLKSDPAVTLPFSFRVKRGAYFIRLVLRDSQSGAMTTITRPEKIT